MASEHVEVAMLDSKIKGKAIMSSSSTSAAEGRGTKKGIAIFDFILRLFAAAAALGAAAAMATTDQKLPFFTQFFQFEAQYNDFTTFSFFVVAMGIVSAYLILSLPFSIVCIIRPHALGPRLFLFIMDTVMMALAMGAAAASASIVYLAHNGNPNANWFAICQQFGDFCQNTSGAVVAAFIAAAILLFLILLSAFALKRN